MRRRRNVKSRPVGIKIPVSYPLARDSSLQKINNRQSAVSVNAGLDLYNPSVLLDVRQRASIDAEPTPGNDRRGRFSIAMLG